MEKITLENFKKIEIFRSLTDEELRQIGNKIVIKRFDKN